MKNFIYFVSQILLKTPSGRSVSQGDSFSVNGEFKHALKKVIITIMRTHLSSLHSKMLIEIIQCSLFCLIIFYFLSDLILFLQFRIPMAFLEDEQTVPKNIEVERGSAIDATIVRIMKARKVLSHVQLVGEILQQLAFFVPDPKLIKQRVEMLIEKEYLKRDSIDNKSYHYIP